MSRYQAEDWIPTVSDALSKLTVGELKQLAALVCSDPLPPRKGNLVALLGERLAREDVVRERWESLGEIQRAAVSEVVHGYSPRLDRARFRAKYGRDPDWGSLDGSGRDARPTALRLFLYGNGVMPDDLRERLQAFVPAPASAALATVDELPTEIEQYYTFYDGAAGGRQTSVELIPLTVRETERAALYELEAVLRLVESGKLSVSDKTHRPSAAAMRLIAAALHGGEPYPDEAGVGPIKAFAWPMLVQAAGLAELRGSRLALTKVGSKALGAPPATMVRTIWDRWVATKIVDELSRVDAIKGQTGKGRRSLTAAATRRVAIADALASCPVSHWVAIDELFRYMRAAGHDFEVTRDPWSLYISDPEYGSLGYDGCGGWDILQARYALCLLFEYAATLGLIDVAYVPPQDARADYQDQWGADGLEYLSRYDGLTYIRLTPLGDYALGCADAYEPPALQTRTAFTVLANLDLVATHDGLSFADRLVIERYAERTADHVWRLNRDLLLTAVEQGESIDDVREFLIARSATPLPATILSLLGDIADQAQRFVDRGPMRVIDCNDPALVALLANGARTRALCIAAGENRLLVPSGCEPAFRRAVRKLGYAVQPGEPRRAAA